MTRPNWHKSTYSDGATNCVEVQEHAMGADVRDTTRRDREMLSFPKTEWTAFVFDLRGDRLR